MDRHASQRLDLWLRASNRKPLILRGARQVGKTWLVRDFAARHRLDLIELNLERSPNLADLFAENNPGEILHNIEAELSKTIQPESAVLFLDEIQAAPELLAKLRWFKEEMPRLPVIAAGSLLEFALHKIQFSMPVGRVTFQYLEPLSFFEFLAGCGQEPLYRKLSDFSVDRRLPVSLHEKCLQLYREYCLIGGLPEVVAEWIESRRLKSCLKLHQDLLATYRDDFHKYGGEVDARLLARIMLSVARQLGSKFVYSRVDPNCRVPLIRSALTMLSEARVCSKVVHTAANGIPLGAETNDKFFKVLMLDIGLVSAQLGVSAMSPAESQKVIFSNQGGMAEQFVGQQLRSAQSQHADPQLHYWQRIGGRLGEIDYVVQQGNRIVPVEVKAGPAGSMKSLHQFMAEKKLDLAVRCNVNPPSAETLDVKTTLGQPVSYRLVSLPVYLAERIGPVIDAVD